MRWIVPVIAAAACGLLVWAAAAGAGTSQAAKTAPFCKAGQKSTAAHPCRKPPTCKAGQKSTKAHPCTKPAATTASRPTGGGSTTSSGSSASTGSSGGSTTTSATSPAIYSQSCGPGETMPQGPGAGDGDDDQNGGTDDGDSCL